MINNKFKKALMILGLGLGMGIGLSTSVIAYPNEAVCRHLEEQCDQGSANACNSFGKWCGGFALP